MKEPVKNVAASVLTRLKNQNEILERPFAEILQYYAMERFLYRLSQTEYADKFILKGGLLFYAWSLPLRRPTRDIDFRGYVSSNKSILLKIIKEIISISVPEDGLIFDAQSVVIEETQIDADYQGTRIKLIALLERSKIPIQIDIGFSDELTSKAETIKYPNLLPNLKTTHMKGYPKETVVAEKFHAMVRHAELNSRMKDYYDLWLISETFDFDIKDLQKAIEATFTKRDTEIPLEQPLSLTIDFARTGQTRWINFLDKMNLENNQVTNFVNVVEQIWDFLQTPLQASINKTKLDKKWKPNQGWK
ncbi:MAG TPA: nucleotidyl transferase AbiEii/AbiGii toxin family protein [Anaerolineae bacterium]|nr:nucleotidyl transferase AbiEii/AbiGii toxin family protein [Flavobacterium sp.]HCK64728.1 nucleotidyl transferase AbiEii/AbiGii toxin family protein [Anaerolineae bacterium]